MVTLYGNTIAINSMVSACAWVCSQLVI